MLGAHSIIDHCVPEHHLAPTESQIPGCSCNCLDFDRVSKEPGRRGSGQWRGTGRWVRVRVAPHLFWRRAKDRLVHPGGALSALATRYRRLSNDRSPVDRFHHSRSSCCTPCCSRSFDSLRLRPEQSFLSADGVILYYCGPTPFGYHPGPLGFPRAATRTRSTYPYGTLLAVPSSHCSPTAPPILQLGNSEIACRRPGSRGWCWIPLTERPRDKVILWRLAVRYAPFVVAFLLGGPERIVAAKVVWPMIWLGRNLRFTRHTSCSSSLTYVEQAVRWSGPCVSSNRPSNTFRGSASRPAVG